MQKVKKIASGALTTFLLIIFALFLYMIISAKVTGGEPNIFGYQLKSVLSGSMEPAIKTGSIIAVKPTENPTHFKVGDVITFLANEDGKLITHRVFEVKGMGDQTQYITKGDNNNAPDSEPVIAPNVVAEYNGFTIPYIGYLLNYAQSKVGSALLLGIPGILLLGYAVMTVWQAIKEIEIGRKSENSNSEK